MKEMKVLLENIRQKTKKMVEPKFTEIPAEICDRNVLEKVLERPIQLVKWTNIEDLHLECADSIYLQQLVLANFYLLETQKTPKWISTINDMMISHLQEKYGPRILPNLKETR